MILSVAISNIVPSLVELVVGLLLFVAGFAAGVFRPILSDDYRQDRDFCRELSILLTELREESESLDSSVDVSEFRNQQNEIESKAIEVKRLIQSDDVPLHRRELQKNVEQLLSELTDVVASVKRGSAIAPESDAKKQQRLEERAEKMQARSSAADDIVERIQELEDSYSYGIVVFTRRLVVRKLT